MNAATTITSFQNEVSSRTSFALVFEFLVSEYEESSETMQILRAALRQRIRSRIRFLFTAFFINLGLLLSEAYQDRWEAFEQEEHAERRQLLLGYLLLLMLATPFGAAALSLPFLPMGLIALNVLSVPLIYVGKKTAVDCRNYTSRQITPSFNSEES